MFNNKKQVQGKQKKPRVLNIGTRRPVVIVLWALLMKNNPVSRIAVFGLLIPVITVLLSALLNGETLMDWRYLAALVLVCAGICLVNRRTAPSQTT